MTNSEDRAWDVIEKVSICMLTTRTSGGDFHARPVEARPAREEGCVYIVTDVHSAKEHEIERDSHLGLTFIDKETNAYLTLAGRATVIPDKELVKRWWHSTDSLWWKGPDDPNVCVLRAELTRGSLWDGPSSKAVEIFEFIKAKVTGAKPNLGENRRSDISLGPK
ncbi:MAG TPA: pyridoxamine 5'-phosphate oxidase family protein [Xanthobacteraceae bacterium]|jgi:general stress protein 26